MTINTWINAFLKPKETFAAEKTNASIGKGTINYLIAGIIMGAFSFLLAMVFPQPNVPANVVSIILVPIGYLIFTFIGVGILFVIAKLLGGQGSYAGLFYLISTYSVMVALLSWIPLAGLLALLYSLYLLVLAIKEAMQLTTVKAILTIILPAIVLFVISIILAVIVGAAALAYLFSPSTIS